MRRSDYTRLEAGRAYFGDFDPFDDFDFIFGGSKLGLKVVKIPIRYATAVMEKPRFRDFDMG